MKTNGAKNGGLRILFSLLACGFWQIAVAQDSLPLCPATLSGEQDVCNGKGVPVCTPLLTAQTVSQTQGFTCPKYTSTQFKLYGCYYYDKGQKKPYDDKCANPPNGLKIDVSLGFAKANFNYSAPASQQFQVKYCCSYES